MANRVDDLQKQLKDLQEKFEEVEEAYKELRLQYTQIDSLYSIISALSAIVDFDELLKYTKQIFRNSFKVHSHSLMLLDEACTRLALKSSFGLSNEIQKIDNFLIDGTIFSRAINEGRTIFLNDLSKVDPSQLYPGADSSQGSFLTAPLLVENERIIGLLNLSRAKPNDFDMYDREFVEKIAEQLAYTLNKMLIYEHTKELSITDDLTGIFNRRYFKQRFESEIQRAKRYNHSLSIQMLDIDNFKIYNDINGHILGDEVLKGVSVILEKILRKTDLIARFGGEEFIILLPEISKEQSRKVANKLRREIEKAEFENEATLPKKRITISVGLSVFPDDSRDPEKLVQLADDALYRAKSMGRNCVVWHGMADSESSKSQSPQGARKVASKTFN